MKHYFGKFFTFIKRLLYLFGEWLLMEYRIVLLPLEQLPELGDNKALEIALNTNDQQTTKDDTCIAAFLFGIKTWDKDIGEHLERFIQRDMPFTEVTTKFF